MGTAGTAEIVDIAETAGTVGIAEIAGTVDKVGYTVSTTVSTTKSAPRE